MEALSPSREIAEAAEIMEEFAARTGLTGTAPKRRYLWTDAFALCNFLTLKRATGRKDYARLARALIGEVHEVLGQHRPDDPRKGWLSGLSDEKARVHPTLGGLRIGKPLPERPPDAPFDPDLEWERDGQYYHYLTKWAHALTQAGCALSEPRYITWAIELMQAANRAFIRRLPDGRLHMVWKMRADLSEPLVPSTGQHDPLDGLITCLAAERAAQLCAPDHPATALDDDLGPLASLAGRQPLVTDDPLGIGGLLFDAGRLAQMAPGNPFLPADLAPRILAATQAGLEQVAHSMLTGQPPARRLAFRELGLAIGLALPECLSRGEETPHEAARHSPLMAGIMRLARHRPLRDTIVQTWRDPRARQSETWRNHEDMNSVMLATALAPEGFLVLNSPGGQG